MRRFAEKVFFILYYVIVILFCAGYAARYIHPGSMWWLQLVALSLPILSLIVLLSTVVVAFMKVDSLSLIQFGLCAMIVVRFFPPFMPPPYDAQGTITIMSFNAGKNYGMEGDGEQLWRQLIAPVFPELVAVQEPGVRAHRFGVEPADHGLEESGYTAFLPPDSSEFSTTYLVLSRIEVEAVEEIRSGGSMGDDSVPLALRVVFNWQGNRMVLYSVHLRSFREKPWKIPASQWMDLSGWGRTLRRYRADLRMRSHDASELKHRMDQESVPYIVAGDFNSTPHNWPYGRLARGMRDAHFLAGRGLGLTFPTNQPLVRIDYILASREWQVVSAEIAPPSVISDHRATVGRLVLNNSSMEE